MRPGARLLHSRHQMLSDPPLFRRGIQQFIPVQTPNAGSNFTTTVSGNYWDRLLTASFTFAASATAANRSAVFQFLDGNGFPFFSIPVFAGLVQSQTANEYGTVNFTSPQQGEGSIQNEGSQTAPGAGTAIATLGSMPAGTYNVTAWVTMSGTLTAGTDNNNIRLYNGGLITYANLDNSIQLQPQQFGPFEITVPASGGIIAEAIGAGTAASVYSVLLSAVPVGYTGLFSLPDIVMESGWGWGISIGNIQAADQLSGITLLAERYASDYASGGWEMEQEDMLRRIIRDELEGSRL